MCEKRIDECACNCHRFPGTKHFVACCDGKTYDAMTDEERAEINPLLANFLKKSRL
jgi:hypothetical protein